MIENQNKTTQKWNKEASPWNKKTPSQALNQQGDHMDLETLMKTLVKRALANQSSANKQSR